MVDKSAATASSKYLGGKWKRSLIDRSWEPDHGSNFNGAIPRL
jgi:hypothetical protein